MRKLLFTLLFSLVIASVSKAATAVTIFDPATFTGTLPAGMSIIDTAGGKYLRVVLDGWNSFLAIPNVTIDSTVSELTKIMFKTNIIINKGTYTGLGASDIANYNSFIQLYGTNSLSSDCTSDSVTTSTTIRGYAKAGIIDSVQFAIQDKANGWNAMTGAVMYIGKIETYEYTPTNFAPRVTYDVKKGTPKVNGMGSDDAWIGANELTISNQALPAAGVNPTQASSGTLKALWDAKNLYILVEANDPGMTAGYKPTFSPDGALLNPWFQDAIELYFDIKNRRYDGARLGDQLQIRMSAGDTAKSSAGGIKAGKYRYMQYLDAGKWIIEATLPWDSLKAEAGYTKDVVYDSRNLSFEVSLVNGNGKGATDSDRLSLMNWANNTSVDVAYTTSKNWGQITLKGNVGPQLFTLTGDSVYCEGTTGVTLSLAGSVVGVSYQLKKGGVNYGTATAGTGSPLQWPNITAGVYSVVATDTNGTASMNGTITVIIRHLPTTPIFESYSSSVLIGNKFTLNVTANNADRYLWNTISQSSSSHTYTFTTAGKQTITVKGSNNCGTSAIAAIAAITVIDMANYVEKSAILALKADSTATHLALLDITNKKDKALAQITTLKADSVSSHLSLINLKADTANYGIKYQSINDSIKTLEDKITTITKTNLILTDSISYLKRTYKLQDDGSIILSVSAVTGNFTIKVFPNPTWGPVTVTGSELIQKLDVFDVAGKLVFTDTPNTKEVEFNLGDITTGGYYTINVTTAKGIGKLKLLRTK